MSCFVRSRLDEVLRPEVLQARRITRGQTGSVLSAASASRSDDQWIWKTMARADTDTEGEKGALFG